MHNNEHKNAYMLRRCTYLCNILYIYMIQIIYKRVSPSLQLLNFKIGYDIKIAIN